MKREIISCDECGAEKKFDNWYSLVTSTEAYLVYRLGTTSKAFDFDDERVDKKDLCSEECLQKAEFKLRGKM